MKNIVIATTAFIAGAGVVYVLQQNNTPEQIEEIATVTYPVTYALAENATVEGGAPQLVSHQLELLSVDEFLYSADGHMTYERVRGDIVKSDNGYSFEVKESYKGRFEEDDVLFITSELSTDELSIEWVDAVPLIKESDSFKIANSL